MNDTLSDPELMTLIAERNQDALIKLYDRFEKQVYVFAYRLVKNETAAEEVVQELFMRIWNGVERFDVNQDKLTFTGWMFSLTRTISIDKLRKKRILSPQDASKPEQLQAAAEEQANIGPEGEIGGVGGKVKTALEGLGKDQRQMVEWIYYQGYTRQEISDGYSIPPGAVTSSVKLAVKQLKKRLSDAAGRESGNGQRT